MNTLRAYESSDPQISIVVPAYNEEGNLAELYSGIIKVLPNLGMSWELIICDDGSDDGTWEAIVALHERDQHVHGIRLARNFGHQYALYAGLAAAKGMAVVSMDADLQHPPEIIPSLVARWRQGYKIVCTARLDFNHVSFMKRITSRLFYKVFSFLSGVTIDQGVADFRLLDQRVVTTLLECDERGLFLRGLIAWTGYPSCYVEYRSKERFTGKTKYSYLKMLSLAWNGIVSFSIVPLRLGIVLGILTSITAFGGIAYALYAKFISGTAVPGWASAVSIISFLFGVLFVLLGLIGEYIGRIFMEVRGRPRFVIDEVIGIEFGSNEGRFVLRHLAEVPPTKREDLSIG